MVSAQNIMVQQTQERHRLSLPALASRLGVAVNDLRAQRLGKAVYTQVKALSQAAPEPLEAVYDMLTAERQELSEALLEDARSLANKVLGLTVRYAYMPEQHQAHLTALNHLRLFMDGKAKDKGRDYIVAQKTWQAARPVEALLESWVKANNLVAQHRVFRELEGAQKKLETLRTEELAGYEENFGKLPAVHAVLEDFDQKYQAQATTLEAYFNRSTELMAKVPLSFGGQGQNLSLSAQMPREARAQAMAEEALASLRASQQTDERTAQQQRKVREQEVVDGLFHKLLATLEADQEPDAPTITAAELAPTKDTPSTPKASPAASLKKMLGVAVPKAPQVKRAKPEQAELPTQAQQTGQPEPAAEKAPQTATAPSKAVATVGAVAPATSLPTATIAALPKEATVKATGKATGKATSKAPVKATIKAPVADEVPYKDTGLREPGWQAAHEKMLKPYLKRGKGYFSSKNAFAAIQRNIMVIRHAVEMGMNAQALRRFMKTLRWPSGYDPPPAPS